MADLRESAALCTPTVERSLLEKLQACITVSGMRCVCVCVSDSN